MIPRQLASKLQELKVLVAQWQGKKDDLQSLVGKLQHASKSYLSE